jgi:hypothetical protein
MRGYRFSPRVLYLLGAVLIVISLSVYMKHSSFVAAAAHADGEVIKLEKRSAGRRSKGSYYPVVRFKDERGVERTFTGSVGSQPSAWNVGEAVDVVYPPGSPGKAEVNDFASQSLVPLAFGFIGVVLCVRGWFRARDLQP